MKEKTGRLEGAERWTWEGPDYPRGMLDHIVSSHARTLPLRPCIDVPILSSVIRLTVELKMGWTISSVHTHLEIAPFFPSFLVKMHEKRGNFCIFLLKIAEKEEKTHLWVCVLGFF